MPQIEHSHPEPEERRPAYLSKLLSLGSEVSPGKVRFVDVLHDDWCSLLAGRGVCDCNPDVMTRKESRDAHKA